MPTSGPIVRTGATPEFWKNWENVFGGKKKGTTPAPAKSAKKKVTGAKAAKATPGTKKSKGAGKKK